MIFGILIGVHGVKPEPLRPQHQVRIASSQTYFYTQGTQIIETGIARRIIYGNSESKNWIKD